MAFNAVLPVQLLVYSVGNDGHFGIELAHDHNEHDEKEFCANHKSCDDCGSPPMHFILGALNGECCCHANHDHSHYQIKQASAILAQKSNEKLCLHPIELGVRSSLQLEASLFIAIPVLDIPRGLPPLPRSSVLRV